MEGSAEPLEAILEGSAEPTAEFSELVMDLHSPRASADASPDFLEEAS